MTAGGEDAADPTVIEVGASLRDGKLRYWAATRAVAEGELLLGSQTGTIGRLVTIATSMLGWSVTISLALSAAFGAALAPATPVSSGAAVAIKSLAARLLWPALGAESFLLIAAVCCVAVLWPGEWRAPGHEPGRVMSATFETELEVLESMAGGYAIATEQNSRKLDRLQNLLRVAWLCFLGAPLIGLILFVLA